MFISILHHFLFPIRPSCLNIVVEVVLVYEQVGMWRMKQVVVLLVLSSAGSWQCQDEAFLISLVHDSVQG